MEDFFRPKIVWKRIGSKIRFCYDSNETFPLDSTVIATGKHMKFLVLLLNSQIHINELLNNSPKTGTGDVIISVQALSPLKVYIPSIEESNEFNKLFDKLVSSKNNKEIEKNLDKINNIIYGIYSLNEEEIKYILSK